jgi:hypothetical protein
VVVNRIAGSRRELGADFICEAALASLRWRKASGRLSANPASAGSRRLAARFPGSARACPPFTCGFAGSNMSAMINDITEDMDTTVAGVEATIMLFRLTMAILLIPSANAGLSSSSADYHQAGRPDNPPIMCARRRGDGTTGF